LEENGDHSLHLVDMIWYI